MVKGTPYGGLAEIVERAYINGADYTLVLYTNAADSLNLDTLAANLTQPTQQNGYAPIVLTGTWAVNNGILTYQHPAGPNTDILGNPMFVPTGVWSDSARGAAIIFGSRVVHFQDIAAFTPVSPFTGKLAIDLSTVTI